MLYNNLGFGDPITTPLTTTQKVTFIAQPVPINPAPGQTPSAKWYDVLNDFADSASNILTSVKGSGYQANLPAAPSANPDPTKSNTTKYLLIGGGVLAAGVAAYFIMKKKKK